MKILAWLASRIAPASAGTKWLITGRDLYAVSLEYHGRAIAVVRVRADSEAEASLKAVRYLAANIYARKAIRQEETHASQ